MLHLQNDDEVRKAATATAALFTNPSRTKLVVSALVALTSLSAALIISFPTTSSNLLLPLVSETYLTKVDNLDTYNTRFGFTLTSYMVNSSL